MDELTSQEKSIFHSESSTDNHTAAARIPSSEVLPNSPNKSADGSVRTETSTIEYGHEPFEIYQQRVEELCRSLWPDSTRRLRVNSLSTSRIVGLLHGKKFLQFVWPVKQVSIERMQGGGFNRIIAITVTDHNCQSPVRLILRIPRFEDAKPEREVGLLSFLDQHTSIPVAKVKSSDFTRDNALESPYVIQYRIPGNDLQRPSSGLDFPSLSFQQQSTIAREFGKILRTLQATTNPTPGWVEAVDSGDDDRTFNIRPFEVALNALMDDSELDEASHAIRAPRYASTLDFFTAQFQRWKEAVQDYSPLKVLFMEKLSAAATQMHTAGYLGNGQYSLCHLDLNGAPRNVMANVSADDRIAISGILDWDDAVFAPNFVGCAPSLWIWQWDKWVEDSEDENVANDIPTSPERQELKRIWEDSVGPEFLHMAYVPGYRLARRLFQWARDGIHSNEEMRAADKWLDEWAAMRPRDTPQIKRVFRSDVDGWSLATDSDQDSFFAANDQDENVDEAQADGNEHDEHLDEEQ